MSVYATSMQNCPLRYLKGLSSKVPATQGLYLKPADCKSTSIAHMYWARSKGDCKSSVRWQHNMQKLFSRGEIALEPQTL